MCPPPCPRGLPRTPIRRARKLSSNPWAFMPPSISSLDHQCQCQLLGLALLWRQVLQTQYTSKAPPSVVSSRHSDPDLLRLLNAGSGVVPGLLEYAERAWIVTVVAQFSPSIWKGEACIAQCCRQSKKEQRRLLRHVQYDSLTLSMPVGSGGSRYLLRRRALFSRQIVGGIYLSLFFNLLLWGSFAVVLDHVASRAGRGPKNTLLVDYNYCALLQTEPMSSSSNDGMACRRSAFLGAWRVPVELELLFCLLRSRTSSNHS